MNQATDAKPHGRGKRRRGPKNARLVVDEERILRAQSLPRA